MFLLQRNIKLFFLLNIILIQVNSQQPVINEFMSFNELTIDDQYGKSSDWLELYNNSSSTINLSNYYLTDDTTDLKKWKFPDINIGAYEFLLIYLSDKNIVNSEIHTNFKLSSAGEDLILSQNNIIIDKIDSIPLERDVSYGRLTDGGSVFEKFYKSSPGSSNQNNIVLDIPSFSDEQGFYDSSLNIAVQSFYGNDIYYTLNGSMPKPGTNYTFKYSSPLQINDISNEKNYLSDIETTAPKPNDNYDYWIAPRENQFKATVLRLRSYNNGKPASDVLTKTYFVSENIKNKYSIDVLSVVTDSLSLFSNDSGIYVPGKMYDGQNALVANYTQKGDSWERAAHFELFNNNGDLLYGQNAGIRIHGGKTRRAPQKSLRIYSRDKYYDDYFEYKFIPERDYAGYKNFIVQTLFSSERGIVLNDIIINQLVKSLNTNVMLARPVVLFVNGEYWGLHTIRERTDEYYLENLYGIEHDSINILSNSGEVEEGNNLHYRVLKEYLNTHNLKDNSSFGYVDNKIDIDGFIDYFIIQSYFDNYDNPYNFEFWSSLDENSKWKWILYDLDAGFRNHKSNTFEYLLNESKFVPSYYTLVPTSLFENENFKNKFISRYTELLNGIFKPDTLIEIIEKYDNIYRPEIQEHINRWNYPESLSFYDKMIDSLKTFASQRPCFIRSYLMDYFDLDTIAFYCEPNKIEDDILVFPNPTKGRFSIYFYNYSGGKAKIELYDIYSRKYYSNKIDINGNYIDLNLSRFASGSYILKIKISDKVYNKKLIKSD